MEQTNDRQVACRRYEAEWEGYLDRSERAASTQADAALAAHLKSCAACRQKLKDAVLAGQLLRESLEPAAEPGGAFAARVMALIREEGLRQQFWRPLEILAARMALVAATVLVVLGFYLFELAPAANRAQANLQGDGEASLAPASQPTSKDEILLTLAGSGHGR